MPISGGSSLEFENKRQRRDYFRQVHSIMPEGVFNRTQWSYSPITFSEEELGGVHFFALIIQTVRVMINNMCVEPMSLISVFHILNLKLQTQDSHL